MVRISMLMWYLILVDNELESISIMWGKNNIRWDGITVLMWIIVWLMTRIIQSLISNKILSSIVIVSMGLSFSIIDILYFTICYEWVIIRITMLIITSGSSRKKDGVIKLLYFTLVSSICLIIVIVTNIISYGGTDGISEWSNMEYILVSIRFIIKFRIYRFLSWLTSALAESNKIGSIILSSLILKISIYGWCRFMKLENLGYIDICITMGLVSLILSSIYSMMTLDLKKVIAYSSVILMSLIFIAIVSGDWLGSWLMSLTHSIISSSLFYLVSLLYMFYLSRIMFYYRNMLLISIFVVFWWYSVLSNISFRMTSSFMPEILILYLVIKELGMVSFIVLISGLITSVLTLWTNSKILYSIESIYTTRFVDISRYLFTLISYFFFCNVYLLFNIDKFILYILLAS